MRTPDFLIVGAMKAGTTTLVQLLNQSDDIFIPQNELHYFDKYFSSPLIEYLKNFPDEARVAGEKTPTYSYDPEVPKRIYETFPNIKIIWIFRNPVDRAYSNYWHAYKKGTEMQSFEQAIKNDKKRYEENIFKAYLQRSKYVEQVQRYLEYFTIDQMHFLLFEQLKSNEIEEIEKITEFLNIPTFDITKLPKSNKTYLPRSVYLEHLAFKLFGRSVAWKVIHRLNKKTTPGYPKLEPSLREKLKKYFVPYNQDLSKIIGLDLEAWRN